MPAFCVSPKMSPLGRSRSISSVLSMRSGRHVYCEKPVAVDTKTALELARLISAALGGRGVDRVADRGVTALDRQLLRAETQMRADTLRAALRRLKRTAWISGAVLTAWLVFVFLVLGGMT